MYLLVNKVWVILNQFFMEELNFELKSNFFITTSLLYLSVLYLNTVLKTVLIKQLLLFIMLWFRC